MSQDFWVFAEYMDEKSYPRNPFSVKVFRDFDEMKIFSGKRASQNKEHVPEYISDYWKNGEGMDISITTRNHPHCPECGSPNTRNVVDHGMCKCGGDCWSHPECIDCGFQGYMNSEGIFWKPTQEYIPKF